MLSIFTNDNMHRVLLKELQLLDKILTSFIRQDVENVNKYEKAGTCSFLNEVWLLFYDKKAHAANSEFTILGQAKGLLYRVYKKKRNHLIFSKIFTLFSSTIDSLFDCELHHY